jgi:hypothetical protein
MSRWQLPALPNEKEGILRGATSLEAFFLWFNILECSLATAKQGVT